jgi:sporulation protein YlmC with PRC-barrel domain
MVRRPMWIVMLLVSLLQGETLSTMDTVRSQILTSAVSLYFNARGYGKVENVTVDTTKKSLRFLLLPEGEKQPLNIVIGTYATKVIAKEEYLILQKVQTNRIWLNRIFADHMGEGIKIPLGIVSKGAGSLLLDL